MAKSLGVLVMLGTHRHKMLNSVGILPAFLFALLQSAQKLFEIRVRGSHYVSFKG